MRVGVVLDIASGVASQGVPTGLIHMASIAGKMTSSATEVA